MYFSILEMMQMMHSLRLVKDISVMIKDKVLHADLIVVRLENHEVILGMDWLGKNQMLLNYAKMIFSFRFQYANSK